MSHLAAESATQGISGRTADKWLVLATVGLGTFISVLDSSAVNVSLPVITRELGTDVTTIQWVVMAYLLTVTGLLLTFGRLADLVGRKPVYVAGMAVFTAGTVACGTAQNVEQLIAFRVVQGVGSAMVMAIGPALTASAFPVSERGKALGINSTLVALGAITGPILGGLLADLMDWRWVFFFRSPLGLLATLMAIRVLQGAAPSRQPNPMSSPPPARQPTSVPVVGRKADPGQDPGNGREGVRAVVRQRFDVPGGVLLFVWMSGLTLGLNQGRLLGWTSPATLILFATAFVGFGAFVAVERRAAEPMLALAVFRNRAFSAASASSLLSFMAHFSVAFLMPFYLVEVLGFAPSAAGLMLLPQPLTMSVVAPISGWLSDRIGPRLLSTTGLGIACLALFSMATLRPDSSYAEIAARLVALGLGIGLFNSPNNSALISSVPPGQMGIASGMLATNRNLGMVMGTAVTGAVWTGRMAFYAEELARDGGLDPSAIRVEAFVGGFHDAFLVSGVICSIGVLTSLVRGKRPEVEE